MVQKRANNIPTYFKEHSLKSVLSDILENTLNLQQIALSVTTALPERPAPLSRASAGTGSGTPSSFRVRINGREGSLLTASRLASPVPVHREPHPAPAHSG